MFSCGLLLLLRDTSDNMTILCSHLESANSGSCWHREDILRAWCGFVGGIQEYLTQCDFGGDWMRNVYELRGEMGR